MTALRLAAALLALAAPSAQALGVSPFVDADELAGVLAGGGITIVPGSARYTGAPGAAGTFAGGVGSGIGIERGVLLTSGLADLAAGPNASPGETGFNDTPGDDELSQLAGYETFDAAVLEFDFTSNGGNLYFNYVFASEEYSEWVGSAYNDVFGFFLDGANIALFPGTGTPVGVNTVNNGISADDEGDPVNPEFFVDNDGRLDEHGYWLPSRFDLEYDGFTVVLTARALGLEMGKRHHIRLAVADASDGIIDSAVFLQAGTFSDAPAATTVPEPGTLALLGSGLAVLTARLGRRRA